MERSFAVLPRLRSRLITAALLLLVFQPTFLQAQPPVSATKVSARAMEMTRPARTWEFLDAVGQRAGLLGNEGGTFEAWVYPLKLFGDFRLTFRADGREVPGSALVRTVTMRPEAATLLLASDAFSVNETWFVPRDKPGALIKLDIATHETQEIEATCQRQPDFSWPTALVATYGN